MKGCSLTEFLVTFLKTKWRYILDLNPTEYALDFNTRELILSAAHQKEDLIDK